MDASGWIKHGILCLSRLLAGFLLFVGLVTGAMAAPAVNPSLSLDMDVERYEVGPHLEILQDVHDQWDLSDILNPDFRQTFSPVSSATVNLGINSSSYWVRFSLQGTAPPISAEQGNRPWLLDLGWPFFAQVEAYMVVGETENAPEEILPIPFCDIFRSVGQQPLQKQGMLARLPELSPGEQTIYLHLRPEGVFFLYPVICTVPNYLKTSALRMLWFGLYLGLLLGLLLYNLFLYFCLRDRSYLWYVTSMGAIGVYFLGVNRLTFEFLFDFTPDATLRLSLVALAVSLLSMLLFVRCFLQTRERGPRFDRVILGILLLLLGVLLQIPFCPVSYLNRCFLVVGCLVPFALIITALTCWLRGYRPARFLVLSWGVYGAGGLVYALTFQGWLPFTYLTYNSFLIGSALEAILLSLALADRINLLRREREQLSFSEQRHKELAVTDMLTGLCNRRYFESQIGVEIERADRFGQKVTLMMLDVDNFKVFNDRYGHQEGDRVLATLGEIMISCVREKDVPCRYGGEEFSIILPGGQNSTAVEIYERINSELQGHRFGCGEPGAGRITMSIGVAEHLPGEPAENLVRRADQALYEAKHRGRNQIVIASREPEAVFFSCFGLPPSSNQPRP